MTLTLELPAEVEHALEESAHANGQSIGEFVSAMVASVTPGKTPSADDAKADIARRLAALDAVGRYSRNLPDHRAEAGLPPLDDTGISRADFYGYTEREDEQL